MARDTKTDTHNLALALDAIRHQLPEARYVDFETTDQNVGYSFWLNGILDADRNQLVVPDALNGEVTDYVADIDWNSVMGESKEGYATFDLTTAISHDFRDRPAPTCCNPESVEIATSEPTISFSITEGGIAQIAAHTGETPEQVRATVSRMGFSIS